MIQQAVQEGDTLDPPMNIAKSQCHPKWANNISRPPDPDAGNHKRASLADAAQFWLDLTAVLKFLLNFVMNH